MSTDDATVSALADAIERYLAAHPRAADSAEGIRAWWIVPPLDQEPLDRIVAALESLVSRGIVEKSPLKRGQVVFRGVQRNGG